MSSFNYEKSIWGNGSASLKWSEPSSYRMYRALTAIKDLPAGSKVLEVGTGAGQFIRAIKNMRPELQCLGSDISVEAISQAKTYQDGVEYSLNQENTLPYPDGSIDAVLIFDVLEHVAAPEIFIKEVYRVLKKDGLAYVFVPCEGDYLSLWNVLEKMHLKKDLTRRFAGHINYFSRKKLFDLYLKTGFTIQTKRYSEHFFGQIVGVLAYVLMSRVAKKKHYQQLNNEAYFDDVRSEKTGRGLGRVFRNFVNSLLHAESRIFARLPSPNVHVVLKKMI
jgi:ubiquinone/menaquinone biosynthesis C-methylase UbiE